MTLALAPALRDWIPATRALTIGGQLVAGEGGSIDVFNPATEQVIAVVNAATTAQVDAAVRAARTAFGGWSQLSGDERSRAMHRLADVLEVRVNELTASIVNEVGTPVTLAEVLQVVRGLLQLRLAGALGRGIGVLAHGVVMGNSGRGHRGAAGNGGRSV